MTWEPIETAPRDEVCLVYGDSAGEINGVFPEPSITIAAWSGRGDYPGFDWVEQGGDAYVVWVRPTHWMPLPEPPLRHPSLDAE